MNVDEILQAAAAPKSSTRFQRWLESQPKNVQALFWDVVQRGYVEEGREFARLLRAFLDAVETDKAFTSQSVKRWVDRTLERDS